MPTKPEKPYLDFPLYAHANGQWAKKIRGKTYFFGLWSEWETALRKYQDEQHSLQAGLTPRSRKAGLTMEEMVNLFLEAKQLMVDGGELSSSTWRGYAGTGKFLLEVTGRDRRVVDMTPQDFDALRRQFSDRRGLVSVGNLIRHVRVIFKWAYDSQLIDEPVRFSQQFKPPSKTTLRRHKQSQPKRLFTADEIQILLNVASPQLKAMIHLGINCGFGQTDCALLTFGHLNFPAMWFDYPRPKTAVERSGALWPETVAAIDGFTRPMPASPEWTDRVFLTKYGNPWVIGTTDSVAQELRKLLNDLGIRSRLNFYALRHTFETVAGESQDQVAVNHIMGHADASMAAVYREGLSMDRLRRVSEHVRTWLFGS